MSRAPRKTDPAEAKRIADKYVPRKGKKAAPADEPVGLDGMPPRGADTTPESGRKTRVEVRVVERAPAREKLTDKEAFFVEEYLHDFNATQAAIRAGYSAKSARSIGYENLTKPHIRAAIEAAKRDRLVRLKLDTDGVLSDLNRDVYADIAELFDPDTGAVKPIHEWPIEFRTGLVAGMDVEEIKVADVVIGQVVKPRFADRTKIKKMRGDHINLQAFNPRAKPMTDTEGTQLAKLMREIGGNSFRPQIEARAQESTTTAAVPAAPASTFRPAGEGSAK